MKKDKADQSKLDKKSLELLQQIDAELERQHQILSNASNHEPTTGNMPKLVFSLDYERRKQLILDGKAEEVEQEIRRKKRKLRAKYWTKSVASCLFIVLFSILLISPGNVEGALRYFGQSIMNVFTTHSEFSFPRGNTKNEAAAWGFPHCCSDICLPDGFSVKEVVKEERHAYLRVENEAGVWFSLDICDANNLSLALDTEGAEENDLLIADTLVKQYSKTSYTILLWEQAGRSFILSGNQPNMLEKLTEKIIGEMLDDH